jgi:hypothetical protein
VIISLFCTNSTSNSTAKSAKLVPVFAVSVLVCVQTWVGVGKIDGCPRSVRHYVRHSFCSRPKSASRVSILRSQVPRILCWPSPSPLNRTS